MHNLFMLSTVERRGVVKIAPTYIFTFNYCGNKLNYWIDNENVGRLYGSRGVI
jgi:hypothetical protein